MAAGSLCGRKQQQDSQLRQQQQQQQQQQVLSPHQLDRGSGGKGEGDAGGAGDDDVLQRVLDSLVVQSPSCVTPAGRQRVG
jgi:hypothetical protein